MTKEQETTLAALLSNAQQFLVEAQRIIGGGDPSRNPFGPPGDPSQAAAAFDPARRVEQTGGSEGTIARLRREAEEQNEKWRKEGQQI